MLILQKLFNALSPSFIKRLIDPVTHGIDKFVISALREQPAGGLVLDAGAGECRFRQPSKNLHYIATDTVWGDPTWDYSKIDVVSSIDNLCFVSYAFDLIICTQVLEHVKEPQQVIDELFRALKKEGVICLTAPQGWGVHQAPHDYYRFTCYALHYLLENSGFEKITITPSCGYFGYLANRLTVLPKTLFWQISNRLVRIILFPLELVSYFLFILVFPVILNAMDFLDRKQNYTLIYFVKGRKPNDP